MVRIAVDAMGGDRAPEVAVEGAVLAARVHEDEIALVGQKEVVERELRRHSPVPKGVEVVPASQAVAMGESPGATLRKRDSSLMVAFELMKRGDAAAVVSAGNSGAMMAAGMYILGNLPHVERPAITVVVPNLGRGTVIIDAGANVDCKPRHLLQFGFMGSIYAERVMGIPRPRVGILSNGEEEGKGNDLTRAVREMLQESPLNCVGYVEGRDITNGKVDVVVCDGFTGNVTLKTMEGVAGFILDVLKQALQQNTMSKLGYLLVRKSLRKAFARLDYAEYGGAPLLGLNGVAIVAHGGSGSRAIKNAIRVARETAQQDVNSHILEMLETLGEGPSEKGGRTPRRIWQQIRSKLENMSEKLIPEGQDGERKSGEKE